MMSTGGEVLLGKILAALEEGNQIEKAKLAEMRAARWESQQVHRTEDVIRAAHARRHAHSEADRLTAAVLGEELS